MRIHVAFTPAETAPAPIGIVVDVLRATSTIAQALASGYERVLCCAEIEDALALRAELPDSLVGGERKAVRIEGFDVGASPREFLEPRARDADPVDDERDAGDPRDGATAASEVAARQPAQPRRGRRARSAGRDAVIVCAGFQGAFALDDAYCAGRIVQLAGVGANRRGDRGRADRTRVSDRARRR